MNRSSTGLISNLKKVYASYGGWKSLWRSAYFWLSIILTSLCWRYTTTDAWAEMSKNILPALAGFSIAAYAVFFAVLDEKMREALREPSDALGGRSPLLILASSVSHGLMVQVLALLVAIVYLAKPIPHMSCFSNSYEYVNIAYSAVGLFLTLYGVTLVAASVLSIFRVLEIRTRI